MPAYPTCAVLCRVYDQSGVPEKDVTVVARLDRYEVYEGYIIPQKVIGVTDENGECILELWPNELGSVESLYDILISGSGNRRETTTAIVPNVATANLHEIAELPAYEGKTEGQLSLEAAIAVTAPILAAATAAANSATAANTSATEAAASAAAALVSETNAAASATSADTSRIAAEAAQAATVDASGAAAQASLDAAAAATSETNAANSATQASTSATAASTAETNASGSAQLAADWAEKADGLDVVGAGTRSSKHHSGQAAVSATNAQTSADAAAVSESNANTSAISAAASKTAAGISETNSATSAASSSGSAAAAAGSALAAATSETNAAGSATSASASETAASSSASAAATSATNANTYMSAAQLAQIAAQAAETSTASLFDQFGDQYLGSKTSDPTLDNDGNALQSGAFYWNSVSTSLRFYEGSTWVDPELLSTTAATNAQNSATAAATSASNALTSETNAAASETAAGTSETNALASENLAADWAEKGNGFDVDGVGTRSAKHHANQASASATSASNSAATATTQAGLADTARTSSQTAQTAAEAAQTAAELAETNAEAAKVAANTSASSAASSASTATTQAGIASTAASNASTSETNAAASEGAATTAASNASTSATNADSSASAALASQTAAASSASSASTSASNANTYMTTAEAARIAAEAAKAAAEAAESGVAADALSASNSASAAATSETNASNSETAAAGSASSASTSAGTATTQAGIATTQAGLADTARVAAQAAQTAAETAETGTIAARDDFFSRYLGIYANDTAANASGYTISEGLFYWNSTDNGLRIYTGTAWSAAVLEVGDTLIPANNLSDLANVAAARTNLGLGSAAVVAASTFATSAQGTKADTAHGWGNHSLAGYLTSVSWAAVTGKPTTFTPSAHTHTLADVTDSGTAAGLNVPATGNAAVGEVVLGSDTRLSDARTPVAHTHAISNVTGLQTALNGKVDDSQVLTNVPAGAVFTDTTYSVGNGGLTEINFTTTKNSLLGSALQSADLNGYALESYVDGAISDLVATAPATLNTLNELAAALGDDPNFATTVSTQIGGKANAVHTHAITDVTGLQTALNGKVDDAQVLTNVPAGAVFTDTTYSVGNGGLTEINFTSALNSKLSGIATGATNTAAPAISTNGSTPALASGITAAEIRSLIGAGTSSSDNATHTGEVTGSTALTIASNVVDADNLKVTGNGTTSQYLRSDGDGSFTWATPPDTNTTYSVGNGGLTQINFTTALNSKLTGIEAGATADQTGAEIKTAYEAEANTNAYTDAEKSKLAAIEAGANVTDTANVTAAGALMDSEVSANLKTLTLPASTTISTFGASLVDDANAAAARTTLGLGTAATTASTAYATAAQGSKADTAVQPAAIANSANWNTAYSWGNHASAGYAASASLATVATSGSYNDLANKPTIPTVGAMGAMAEATEANIWAWTDSALGLTTREVRDALAPVTISGSANWTPNWSTFNTANWAVTSNRTINNPSTVLVGETKYAFIKSSSTTARTISWGSNYKGNLPDINVTNSNYILVSMTAESATSIVVSFIEIGGA